MNALDIWFECRRLSITLTANGKRLGYCGQKESIERLLPILTANKSDVLACVTALNGFPFADGPYAPWGPFLNPGALKRWQRDLFKVVDELARLEGWRDDDYDFVVGMIERQPASTLRPDLNHFRKRLAKARADIQSRKNNE